MDYRELSRIAGDPVEVRNLAKMIKRQLGQQITDWQSDFLSKLEKFEGPNRLSTRQCESLLSLRNQVSRRSVVGGYKASTLVGLLAAARLDIPEDDEEFVLKLYEKGPALALSDPQWKHVFGLCRQLELIHDPYIPLS
jgi:hypothetical protein